MFRAREGVMLAKRFVIAALAAGALALPARAQPLNPTFNPGASPIVVSQQPEKVAARPTVTNRTLVSLAFGGVLMGGNTKSYAANLGGRFGLNRERHQLTIEGLGSIGYARQGGLTDVERIAQNVIGRVRYDIFLSANDALFLAVAPRHDKFAGLRIRLQNQAGYSRNLIALADTHRLWAELGYDFTYDRFTDPEMAASVPMTMTNPNRPYVHSARVFVGYTNHLSASANLSVGAETLLDFQDKENVRVNGLAELTSSITHSFKLGVQSRILFDNVPAPGVENKYDLIMAVQLVYTFDSSAGPLNAPCPVCDCTTQVNEAKKACRSEPPRPLP